MFYVLFLVRRNVFSGKTRVFFFTFFNFSIHLHKEHCKTNAFFNLSIHLHKEQCKTNVFFNVFERKHSKTSGFSIFLSENTVKPVLFQHF